MFGNLLLIQCVSCFNSSAVEKLKKKNLNHNRKLFQSLSWLKVLQNTFMMINETLWRCIFSLKFSSTLITVIISLRGPSSRKNGFFSTLAFTAGMPQQCHCINIFLQCHFSRSIYTKQSISISHRKITAQQHLFITSG